MNRFVSYLVVALCVLPLSVKAQVPELISFQGNLTNLGGDPISSTESIVFTIYDGSSPIWTETQPTVVITNGLLNVFLGAVTPLGDVRFDRPLELGIKVGSDPEIIPRSDLAGVPYSLGMRGLYTELAEDQPQGTFAYNVVGGLGNATSAGIGSVIAGGGGIYYSASVANETEGRWATVSGGSSNRSGAWGAVGGGSNNRAGIYGSVGGGEYNIAEHHAMVPGGFLNAARGDYSMAAGLLARTGADHYGSFVWSDRSTLALADTFATTGPNQFLIRAEGGVAIGTNIPMGTLTVSAGLSGDTDLTVAADPDNNDENDNPMIRLRQDGVQTGVNMGFDESGYGSNVFGIGRRWSGVDYGDTFLLETASGDVGIGTTSLTNRLRVAESVDGNGASAGNYVSWIENTSAGAGPDVLALSVGTTTPGDGANFLGFFADGTLIGQVDGNGSSVVYNTSGADYAELLPRRPSALDIDPGSVVGVSAGVVSLTTKGAQRVMVVTDRPAVLGNRPPGEEMPEGLEPIAFVGQVPAYVRGVVQAGDYLIPSGRDDGIARAVSSEDLRVAHLDSVIGVAWEASSDPGTKKVIIEVGLDKTAAAAHAFRSKIQTLEERIAALERLIGS